MADHDHSHFHAAADPPAVQPTPPATMHHAGVPLLLAHSAPQSAPAPPILCDSASAGAASSHLLRQTRLRGAQPQSPPPTSVSSPWRNSSPSAERASHLFLPPACTATLTAARRSAARAARVAAHLLPAQQANRTP